MPRETSSVALKAKAVVGLGNPDRADDGVGLAVVEGLSPRPDLDVFASVKTGLDLAMALLPYERVLLSGCRAVPSRGRGGLSFG
jgi:hypothetical protein